MEKKLPVYKLTITDDELSGVTAVAFVDEPAIQVNWVAFNKQQQFKATNEEKRIVSGALMIPDMPIYRNDDSMGEYYVVFEKETIEKISQKFFKQKNTQSVNIMHDPLQKVSDVYMFESFLIDKERGINTPNGFDELPDGTWFGSFKVENDALWEDFIKTGTIKAFSVEGYFEQVKIESRKTDPILDEICRLIS